MSGNNYDTLMAQLENSNSLCMNSENRETCMKSNIINYLRNTYTTAYNDFTNHYNSLANTTMENVVYKEYQDKYNELYSKVAKQKKELQDEIDGLSELIENQVKDTKNYENIIKERNEEIESSSNDIKEKSNKIDTVNEDINNYKNNLDYIYLFGLIPITNVPLSVDTIDKLYKIICIILLLLFIFILKTIKEININP